MRLAERRVQVLRDGEPHIEPDEIGELQGTHRVVVAQLHGLVDVFGAGNALLQHAHRLEAEDHAEPARGKARRIAHHDRLFAELARERGGALGGWNAVARMRDDFHELHHVHGIEEMHPDQPAGRLHRRGNLPDREGRRV